MPTDKQGKGTTQVYNPQNNRYVKRDSSGKFVDVNSEPNKKFPNAPVEK